MLAKSRPFHPDEKPFCSFADQENPRPWKNFHFHSPDFVWIGTDTATLDIVHHYPVPWASFFAAYWSLHFPVIFVSNIYMAYRLRYNVRKRRKTISKEALASK